MHSHRLTAPHDAEEVEYQALLERFKRTAEQPASPERDRQLAEQQSNLLLRFRQAKKKNVLNDEERRAADVVAGEM